MSKKSVEKMESKKETLNSKQKFMLHMNKLAIKNNNPAQYSEEDIAKAK